MDLGSKAKKYMIKGEDFDYSRNVGVFQDSFVLRVNVRRTPSKGPETLGQNKNSKAEASLSFYQNILGLNVISTIQNHYRQIPVIPMFKTEAGGS